jgi:hypothetical protein
VFTTLRSALKHHRKLFGHKLKNLHDAFNAMDTDKSVLLQTKSRLWFARVLFNSWVCREHLRASTKENYRVSDIDFVESI